MKANFAFTIKQKKTPYQRHKEIEEEKKKKAEEEAAKLYEEFVESFKGEEDRGGSRAFVRGGTVMPGTDPTQAPVSTKKAGSRYVPSFLPPDVEIPPAPSRDPSFSEVEEESVFQLPGKKTEKDKPRNIDKMLDVIKREQEAREERLKARREGRPVTVDLPYEEAMGSYDDGDPFTTNLYVGNLAPDVDEQILLKEFGRFGPIASVKIMWPRDDDQRRKGRNCGFVAFMRRPDAEKAIETLNGIDLHEYEMKIGWGKAVPIPLHPIYPPAAPGGSFGRGAVVASHGPGASSTPWGSGSRANDSVQGVGPDIEVKIPEDQRLRFIMDTVAAYVMRDGCAIEQLIMEEEQGNPEFSFLFDLQSPEHTYYRWRLFSLAEGDNFKSWRIEPFVMVDGGQRWVPPPMTAADMKVMTAAQKGGEVKDRDRQLSDLERDRFEDYLRSLTVERQSICDAMVFALDNADASTEVVEILSESLTLSETPVPLKIARLFLTSDILHNSTAPVRNASRYRSKIEAVLPDIFENLQEVYRSVGSRMTQEALRRHVLRLLRVWRDRFIFTDDYLNGLQATFLRPIGAEGPTAKNEELTRELEDLADEELERRCRHSGLSAKGGRTAQVQRLLALDHYLYAETRQAVRSSSMVPEVKPEADAAHAGAGLSHAGSADMAQALGTAAVLGAGTVTMLPSPAAPPGSSMPVSRWETIDAEEEKKHLPEVPISKWLLQEQEAARQQELAQAHALAMIKEEEQDPIFSDVETTPKIEPGSGIDMADRSLDDEGGGGVSGRLVRSEEMGSTPLSSGVQVMDKEDEERRQKLRKIEVEVILLKEQLEEDGLGKEEVEKKVEARREELLAELDGKIGHSGRTEVREHERGTRREPEGGPSRSDSHKDREKDKRDRERGEKLMSGTRSSDREGAGRGSRDGEREARSREHDKERDRGRDQGRERAREADRDHVRDHERDREKDRRDRDRDRSRVSDREREKDKERDSRPREKERNSEKKRDRPRDVSRERGRGRRSPSPRRDPSRERRRTPSPSPPRRSPKRSRYDSRERRTASVSRSPPLSRDRGARRR